MYPRATCISLWILLLFLKIDGRTKAEAEYAICDNDYRSKYIVTKSLYQELQKAKLNLNDHFNSGDDKSDQKTSEQQSENESHSSSDNSQENFDESNNCPELSKAKRMLEKKQLFNNEYSRVQQKQISLKKPTALTISIKTVIGINTKDIDLETKRRRKRETHSDDWEGEISCGQSRRVIGGYVAKSIEELPYMAFVNSGCGGSVISDFWVLTASHCVNADGPTHVYAGSLKLHRGCKHKIEKIVKHPKYDEKTFSFDIALLKLHQPFTFSPAIKAIPISAEKAKPGECGTVSGWGATILNGTMVYDMKISKLPIVRKDRCKMFQHINESQFCAGFRDAQTDTCQGDSGGPFVVNKTLIGIVSYGYKCAVPETPGVYVDVSYHRKWIENVTGI